MKILNVNFTFNVIIYGQEQSLNNVNLSDELSNLKELQKRGHTVATVTTDRANYIIEQKRLKNKFFLNNDESIPVDIFGIPVYILHSTIPSLGWYCPNASKLANNIVKNFDVIHIRNWYHHIAIEFYKSAIKHNIPFVFTAHNSLNPVIENKNLKMPKKILEKLYTKKMINKAAALHSLGNSENKEFLSFGAEPNKIFRIDLGVKPKDFEIIENTDIFSKFGIDKENFPYILFLGRVVKKKGIKLLFQAFAKYRPINLNIIIAGPSTDDYKNELIRIVNKLKIANSVKFIGSVHGSEKAQLLRHAKIFALTSYSDIHPVSVEEALFMGNPVLITKNCDFPEIEEYNAGVIVDATFESVYAGLVKILKSDEKLEEYSKNAKQLANDKFLFENKVIDYENLFQFAINNQK